MISQKQWNDNPGSIISSSFEKWQIFSDVLSGKWITSRDILFHEKSEAGMGRWPLNPLDLEPRYYKNEFLSTGHTMILHITR